jgi:hypothetical protein
LRVIGKRSSLPRQVFPAAQGISFVFTARLIAVAEFRIADFVFHADWLTAPSFWSPRCEIHSGRCCIQSPSGHSSARAFTCLPQMIAANPILRAGDSIQGLLLGNSPEMSYSSVPCGTLESLLHVIDSQDNDYAYPISFDNLPPHQSDSDTRPAVLGAPDSVPRSECESGESSGFD